MTTLLAPEQELPSVVEDPSETRPLRSAAFRWLLFSSALSNGGQLMERTATAWLVLQSGGDGFAIGLVFAARSIPSLLFGLTAGTVADRGDRRRQLMLAALATCLLMALVGWAADASTIRVWQIILLAFGAGFILVCDTPARQALVLDTTSRKMAGNALVLNALASQGGGVLGAFGAGVLISVVGVTQCYFAIAVVYAVGGLLLVPMRVPRVVRSVLMHPPFRQALRDSGRMIMHLPAVRVLLLSGIAAEILAFSFGGALPNFTNDVLRAGPEGLGTLNGAASFGSLAVLLALLAIGDRMRREPLLASIFVIYGTSLVVLATTRSLVIAAAVLVVTGICAGAFDLLQQTMLQLAVPDEQRGRAAGIWVLSLGSGPVGNLEVGALIGAMGAPGALAINGVLAAACAGLLALYAPAYRWKLRVRRSSG